MFKSTNVMHFKMNSSKYLCLIVGIFRFLAVLQTLPDIAVDIPNGPKLFGKFIARAIYNELISTAWLREHLPKLKPNEENNFTDVAIKLLPELFLSLLENYDISRTQQIIQEANINIRDYIPKGKESDEQVDEWLKSTKLDNLFFLYALTKNLEEVIFKGTEPEQISTWIKVSVFSLSHFYEET
jgi:hypothetical protein